MTRKPIEIRDVLEQIRAKVAPDLSSDLVAQVARIEERNQFDEDRAAALRELRKVVEQAGEIGVLEREHGQSDNDN